jgi:hypothetical protein
MPSKFGRVSRLFPIWAARHLDVPDTVLSALSTGRGYRRIDNVVRGGEVTAYIC